MSASSSLPACNAVGRVEREQPALSAGRVDGRERYFRSGAVAAVMEQHGGRVQSTRKKLCRRSNSNRWVRAVPSWIKLRMISSRIYGDWGPLRDIAIVQVCASQQP